MPSKKQQKIPVWSWRHAIEVTNVPALTKLVCYTVANYLSDAGKSWNMRLDVIIAGTGMSKRAVVTHIQHAEAAGLLHTSPQYNHQGHRYCTRFTPRFPDNVELDRNPAEVPETAKNLGASGAPRSKKQRTAGASLSASGASLGAPDAPQDLSSSFPSSESVENQRIITNSESSAATSRAGARKAAEEAQEVEFVDLGEGVSNPAPTAAQSRKAVKKDIAKQLNGKRQPDMLKAAGSGTELQVVPLIIQQVNEAFECWLAAMGDTWAGTRVSKGQRRLMRHLIEEEEDFDYVLALGEALRKLQFGKGQGRGWVVELNELLTDPDKRAKVFGKYQRPPLKKAEAGAPPERFPSKPIITIHGCIVSGEDGNDVLDAVPGSTIPMVRAALKRASDYGRFGADEKGFKKADIARITNWVTTEVKWVIAYATHGDPEKLAGGPAALIKFNDGSIEKKFLCRYAAITKDFIFGLRAKFPQAWAKNVSKAYFVDRDYRVETGDGYLHNHFDSIAQRWIDPEEYGPKSQKAVEDELTEWARAKQAEVEKVLAENEQVNAERRANIARDRDRIVFLLGETDSSTWHRLSYPRSGWEPVYWGPAPGAVGCLIPNDLFDEALTPKAVEADAEYDEFECPF